MFAWFQITVFKNVKNGIEESSLTIKQKGQFRKKCSQNINYNFIKFALMDHPLITSHKFHEFLLFFPMCYKLSRLSDELPLVVTSHFCNY